MVYIQARVLIHIRMAMERGTYDDMVMQASEWEQYAEFTDTQLSALAEIKTIAGKVPLPDHLAEEIQGEEDNDGEYIYMNKTEDMSTEDTKGRRAGPRLDVVLNNSSEFYKWYSELEAARASEAEEKYERHAKALERRAEICHGLLQTIEDVLDIFATLREKQKTISDRTDALRQTCDTLVSERENLVRMSDGIRERLQYFRQLEALSLQFHGPLSTTSDPKDILHGMKQLDVSLNFTASHPQYYDSAKYNAKFRQLQGRAIALVKSFFQDVISAAVLASKEAGLAADTSGDAEDVDVAELTLQNVKFRAVAEPRLKELMSGIGELALESPLYARLIQDCGMIYSRARFEIIRSKILGDMRRFNADITPIEVLAKGSEILTQAAEMEEQLYVHVFTRASKGKGLEVLNPLFDSMCILLCVVVEPMVYASQSNSLDGLCQVNSAVKELIQNHKTGYIFNVPSMNKLLNDIQQLIVSQARSVMRSDVSGVVLQRDVAAVLSVEAMSKLEDVTFPPKNGVLHEIKLGIVDFKPCVAGMKLLGQVYPAVTRDEFNRVGYEIVRAILGTITKASEVCTDAHGELYGAIFTLRQLTLLQRCLESFGDADLKASEGRSGLAQLGSSIRKRLTNSLFSSSRSTHEEVEKMNVHEELKKRMKVAREFCNVACSQEVVNPILSFLTKVTAAKVSDVSDETKPIKSLAFATLDRVTLLSQNITSGITSGLFHSLLLLRIAIPEPEASEVYKPIEENVLEAYEQLRRILEEEYSPEELDQIALPDKGMLHQVFALSSIQ